MRKLKKDTGHKDETVNAPALGGLIIATVITHLDLFPEDRGFVNQELKWLFSAVDNFQQLSQTVQQRLAVEETRIMQKLFRELKPEVYSLVGKKTQAELAGLAPHLWREEIERSRPISEPIPPGAKQVPQANNKLLSHLDPADLQNWFSTGEAILTRLDSYFENLNHLLAKEVQLGDAGKTDFATQNQLKRGRIDLLKTVQELAELMNELYGILITRPARLLDFLEQS